MISKKTCERIWSCHREIAAGEKLLSDLAEVEKNSKYGGHEEKLTDAFGREKDLQLGVPSGQNGHRLFNVAPELAKAVIRAHMANKQAELVEANEQARLELNQ